MNSTTAKGKKGKGARVTSCRTFAPVVVDSAPIMEDSPLSSIQASGGGENALAQALIKTHGCNEENDVTEMFDLSCMPRDKDNTDWSLLAADQGLNVSELRAFRSYVAALRTTRDQSSQRVMLSEGIAGNNMGAMGEVGNDHNAAALRETRDCAATRVMLPVGNAGNDMDVMGVDDDEDDPRDSEVVVSSNVVSAVASVLEHANTRNQMNAAANVDGHVDAMQVTSDVSSADMPPMGVVAAGSRKRSPSSPDNHSKKAPNLAKSPVKKGGPNKSVVFAPSIPELFLYPTPSTGAVFYAGELVVGCTVELKQALVDYPDVPRGCRGRLLAKGVRKWDVEWTVKGGRVETTNVATYSMYFVAEV